MTFIQAKHLLSWLLLIRVLFSGWVVFQVKSVELFYFVLRKDFKELDFFYCILTQFQMLIPTSGHSNISWFSEWGTLVAGWQANMATPYSVSVSKVISYKCVKASGAVIPADSGWKYQCYTEISTKFGNAERGNKRCSYLSCGAAHFANY